MPSISYQKHRMFIEVRNNDDFVTALKRAVPSGYRAYDTTTRTWIVYTPYMANARHIVFDHFKHVEEEYIENYEFAEQAKKSNEERAKQANWSGSRQYKWVGDDRPPYENVFFHAEFEKENFETEKERLRRDAEEFMRRFGNSYNRKQQSRFDDATGTQASGGSAQAWYAVLFVTPNAPFEVIEAAYKALARLYHPDKPTGDTKKMQALNDAYASLKKTRG